MLDNHRHSRTSGGSQRFGERKGYYFICNDERLNKRLVQPKPEQLGEFCRLDQSVN